MNKTRHRTKSTGSNSMMQFKISNKTFKFTPQTDKKYWNKLDQKFIDEIKNFNLWKKSQDETSSLSNQQRIVIIAADPFFQRKDIFGNTPLHYASLHSSMECITLLLKLGVNINATNNEGWKCRELTLNAKVKKLYANYIMKEICPVIFKQTRDNLENVFRT